MEPQQPTTNTTPPPAWHQLNYDPPPQARLRTTRQQPQYTSLVTDFGREFRRMGRGLLGMGRGLRGMGSDVWTLGIKGVPHDIQRFRVFLQHPPRWFFVALIASGIFVDMFFACSLSGVVREQAGYLRSLMP